MKNKVIVYTNDKGILAVVHPAIEMFDSESRTRSHLRDNGIDFKNDEDILKFIIEKDIPKGKQFSIIEKNDLPVNREFRNAWEVKNNTIEHNINECKEIWKDKIREKRELILKKLDVQYQIADENNDSLTKKQIIENKKILRDLPQSIKFDSAKSLEDIKNIWHSMLDNN